MMVVAIVVLLGKTHWGVNGGQAGFRDGHVLAHVNFGNGVARAFCEAAISSKAVFEVLLVRVSPVVH
jgi:hypothetical protein